MNLTKRQKMLSAVFLVGLVGLVVDRTHLASAGRSPSRFGGFPRGDAQRRPGGCRSAPAAESTPTRAPVAERLNNLLAGKETGPNDLRDPFSLPDTWSETAPGDGARAPDAARGFLRRHQLKAVVIQGGESCARWMTAPWSLVSGSMVSS